MPAILRNALQSSDPGEAEAQAAELRSTVEATRAGVSETERHLGKLQREAHVLEEEVERLRSAVQATETEAMERGPQLADLLRITLAACRSCDVCRGDDRQ